MMIKNIVLIVRMIFGGWWLYSGLNHWFHFFEQPYGDTDVAIEFTLALESSGLLTLVKVMEVIQGVLIIGGWAMPLALASALPLSIMIAYWNLVLTPGPVEIVFGILTLLMNGALMLAYWQYYRPMFVWRAKI
jgi:uncharacterized membrane protein YphA (DoxX/SURF4 family)